MVQGHGRRTRRGREEPEGLAEGQPPADPEAAARAIVLRLLTSRARTRAELEAALAQRAVPEDVARHVLDRFTELRLVDDRSFADQWVESGQRRMRSRTVLRQELKAKGVAADLVTDAVALVSDEDEYATARAFAARKASGMRGLDAAVRQRRLLGALARRGFGSGVSYRVVRDVLGELAEGD